MTTRRQLFRVSVLSALGATTVGMLRGCGRNAIFGFAGPQLSSSAPVVGKSDARPYWYLFVFDSEKTQYKVWRTSIQPPSDPAKAAFDTADWYSQLEGANQLTLMNAPQNPPVKIGGRVYDTDAQGYLTGTSSNTMQQNAMILTWVEVGGKGKSQ